MFKKMKLKRYLMVVFSLMILMTGIITAVGISGLVATKSTAHELIDEILTADAAVKTCRIEVNVAARNLREMLLTDDASKRSQMKERINESLDTIQEQIAIFKQTYGTEDGLAEEYESAFNSWFAIADRAIAQIDQGDLEKAKQIVLTECSPTLDSLVTIAKKIDTAADNDTVVHQDHMVKIIVVGTVSCLVVFAATLVIGMVIALRATRNITGAVGVVQEAVEELSKGNLKAKFSYEADNEFGDLVDRMHFSYQELSKYVDAIDYSMSELAKGNFTYRNSVEFIGDFTNIQTSIRGFRIKLNDVMLKLEQAASQVSAGASQVADGAQALAQGATEQASGVEELSSTIAEISQGVNNTSDYAQQCNEMGKQAAIVVEKSEVEMNQLIASIRDITEVSNNIQSIIKVINDIAFQTNILALNAAVEAARAGTAGKGFAVVADEVRDLAQKTATAATDTTELIETSLRHVKKGEELAHQAEEAFGEVSKASIDILGRVEKIANASQEQADSIAQISQGLDQISSVVQTTSATAEESAAASEELNGQAGMMRSLLEGFQIQRL